MYRKYSLNKTHVIDKHNYILEAQDIDSNAFCLIHQILLPDQLPSLHDQRAIQNFISDSENQNLIAETRDQYEFYLDQHLLQIRFRTSIALLTQLSTRPIASILTVVQALNLDFAIASKQLAANSRQRLSNSGLNNACKFYLLLMSKGEWRDCILPFLDGDRLHYYDLHFGGHFTHREEPISLPRSRLGISNIQTRIKKEENQADIFNRYVNFLIIVLSSNNFVELFGQLKQLNKQSIENEKIISRVEKMMNSFQGKTQRSFFELLANCIRSRQEYSLSIFNKQCEIIVERLKNNLTAPKQITQTAVGNFLKPDRLKQSKSCLQLRPEVAQKGKPIPNARLKSSKSEINLTGKARKSKKMPLGLFRTKETSANSNIFQQTWKSTFKQNKVSLAVSQSRAFGNSKFNTANSQWFNTNEVESFQKMRNFKKGNNFNSFTNSPKRGESLAQDKISEEDQSRFLRFQYKAKGNQNQKMDQFTMTQQNQQAEPNKEQEKEKEKNDQNQELKVEKDKTELIKMGEKAKEESRCLLSKKEIINTINIKYYEANTKKELKVDMDRSNSKQKKNVLENKEERSFKQNRKSIRTNTIVNEQNLCLLRPQSPKKHLLTKNKSELMVQNKEKLAQSQMNSKIKMQNRSTPFSGYEEIEQIQLGKTNQSPACQINTSISLEKSQQLTSQQPTRALVEFNPAEFQISHQQQCKFLQTVLRFYKENQLHRASSSSGLSNSLTYLLNLFYLRAVLESRTLESDSSLSGLISLLQKKQQKLPADYPAALIPELASLWPISRPINNIYRQIVHNWKSFSTSKKRIEFRDELGQFMQICDTGGQLLQEILPHLAAQAQSAKPILIQSGLYLAVLHFHQLLAIVIVITLQKARFYQQLLIGDIASLTSCFKLKLPKNAEAETAKYRKGLEGKQLLYVNAVEQANSFQTWMGQYLPQKRT